MTNSVKLLCVCPKTKEQARFLLSLYERRAKRFKFEANKSHHAYERLQPWAWHWEARGRWMRDMAGEW